LYFESDTLNYEIPERYSNLNNYLDQDVILGIRPEHIYLNSNKDEKNSYLVKIGVAEPIGSDTFIYIDFSNQVTMIVKLEGLQRLRVDQEIEVIFDENQIHFFEKESELRIDSLEDPNT
jgi:multiple sugar transport system ATP-binding protein